MHDHCERHADQLASRALRIPGPVPNVRTNHSSTAHPLDPETRAYFEPRFGHDFSRVRVHTDAHAAASQNALAYTFGSDVVFASDRVSPQLMAHELAHVVQQRGSQPAIMRQSTTTASDAGATCSFAQHHKIEPAAVKAHAWVTQALAALDAFLGGAKTTAAQAAGAALDSHFHSTEPKVATYVRQRLAAIETDIFGRPDFRVNCPPLSDPQCTGSTDHPSVARTPNTGEIDLCKIFFERSENDRASTLIHELGHAQLGLRSDQEMTDRAYKDDSYYFYLSTGEALTNAESYAMFARQIATGSTPAAGFISDELRACPDKWVPIISDAITKARMWNHQGYLHSMDPKTKRLTRFARAFGRIQTKLQESQSFKCIPDGGGRCSARVVAYWYEYGDLRICPALIAQPTPDQRALSLLASLYLYERVVDSDSAADDTAREARRLHTANAPAAPDVLRP